MLVIKDSVIAEYKLSVINLSLHTLYWYQGSISIIQWLLCVIQPTCPDTLRREKHIPVSNISQFQTFLFCITSHYICMYNVYVYIYQVKFQMELRSVWQLHTGSCLQCYWTEVTLEYIIPTYTLKSDSLSLWPSSVPTCIVCPSVSLFYALLSTIHCVSIVLEMFPRESFRWQHTYVSLYGCPNPRINGKIT